MAPRKELTFPGPFVRLGNTFFDPSPPAFGRLPDGDSLTATQYGDVSRYFLQRRIEGDFAAFGRLPDYLLRHQNGVLWRDMMMLLSLSMPCRYINGVYSYFQTEIFEKQNQFIAFQMFMLLTEAGGIETISSAVELLSHINPESDHHEIACLFAMVLEENTGYDKSRSAIIGAHAKRTGLIGPAVLDRLAEIRAQHRDIGNARLHSGKPVVLLDVALSLATALERPAFFERIYFEKILIEAYTGVDLRSFYTNLRLDPLRAHDALANLIDTVDLARFSPGRRYFFGEPVVD